MEPKDMESIGDQVELEREIAHTEEGSYLPKFLVEAQVRLAARSEFELTQELADMIVAIALKSPSTTPRRMLKVMLDGYKITDEMWVEKVAPELKRVLGSRGVEI